MDADLHWILVQHAHPSHPCLDRPFRDPQAVPAEPGPGGPGARSGHGSGRGRQGKGPCSHPQQGRPCREEGGIEKLSIQIFIIERTLIDVITTPVKVITINLRVKVHRLKLFSFVSFELSVPMPEFFINLLHSF